MKIFNIDTQSYEKIRPIPDASTKIERLVHAIYCYENEIFEVLYDKTQPSLKKYVENFDRDYITQEGMQFLFFTSGTTGDPTGVYKTRKNIELAIDDLIKVLDTSKIQRVVATVPFIHLYGIEAGALLSHKLGVELHTKENFLIQELIAEAKKPNTLVITTPLFIKALNKTTEQDSLKDSFFITSTAPLNHEDAKTFSEKFNSSVLQIFGSTETGAIAYKINDEKIWHAFESVTLTTENNMLGIFSPFIAPKTLTSFIQNVELPFATEDIVEVIGNKDFELIGRSSNIAKIAGKRISTLQIEAIIENLNYIDAVLIKIKRDDKALKDEILEIYVESDQKLQAKVLKELFTKHFGSLHLPFKIFNHKKIIRSSVGKKIGFE
ncbi:acyl--CoA ligase [Sulfurimonas lithotrophica]|mgnify:CR=1 FL=1|uniref:Acyl--CoA ligase n=1 Tax=Sulfurimonas lithotrophica TaxID=2590022 RepID=A0A5P8P3N0_9BACT|nr:class I adenylate-forming enzyme family protein [Sulfurimonas lithotrophica]QFR50207.1 acyl--CoA ligase [Sulfurimonas lithotrophica]